jgi:hypothetical protein
LILELILHKCNINISYAILTEGLSTQVIVFAATIVGAAGFTFSWFTAGAALVAPPLLVTTLLIRNFTQQMLDDDNLKETLRVFFMKGEGQLLILGE